ncbi:sodium-translocating pyrophosphatase [Oscillatoria laete-virens NRMC-F 0139]|nr:sodium-translocating pyrophosphatase [Oscillatoria laete-virens]MDL5053258.1 sodium-translocating pyrophosphatase [Oscillatoria laete-virens NRMC-F 0139]
MHHTLFIIVPLAAVAALAAAWYFYRIMSQASEGNDRMREIAAHVRTGAMAYLKQQYKIVFLFFLLFALLLAIMAYGLGIQNRWVPFAFVTCGFFSGLAGFFGMKTATTASARVAQAASQSLDAGLRLAFRSGAVMGLVVVGLALLDISFWFVILNVLIEDTDPVHKMIVITSTMLTFGMGASLQALFARVGGGIFTKAADVGADLVGKVEAGIPEDDARNPATIADNVGDNVGDVAGMGADLYESYYGSILAAAALGAAAYMTLGVEMQVKAVITPMIIAATGILLSIGGVFLVRTKAGAGQSELMSALTRSVNAVSALVALVSFALLKVMALPNAMGLWRAVVTGLAAGILIGKSTEYFTSHEYRPTRKISESARTGPATVLITGLGVGLVSTVFPVLIVVLATVLSYTFSAGGMRLDSAGISTGLYGIAICAVGMLSTLGLTLATDAYGPIADNAGGNAEMSGLGPEVRKRTDALDSLGNTTAATGKGFAIGSAALTALALMASYVEQVKIVIVHSLETGRSFSFPNGVSITEKADALSIDIATFLQLFGVTLMNPNVLMGIFIGAMASFFFCGLTINAVGRSAQRMVEEVRRQFREIPGILDGHTAPDYARCVEISTRGAQIEMIFPSVLAVIVPIITGMVFGVAGVFGLLAGSVATGFVLAVFMANAGGAWDNAKKYIEEGHLGGKGSEAHKATVIGDTVGDPLKDTAGPSLNILVKLMSMVSIVVAGITVSFHLF